MATLAVWPSLLLCFAFVSFEVSGLGDHGAAGEQPATSPVPLKPAEFGLFLLAFCSCQLPQPHAVARSTHEYLDRCFQSAES